MRCTLGTVSVAAVAIIVVTSLMPEPVRMPIGGAPSTAWARPGADEQSVAVADLDDALNQKLDEARLTLDFDETPGREAVEFLREKLAIDVVMRGDVLPQLDQPVNLTVKHSELSGRTALQLVLEQLELSYVIRDGLIHIRPPHDSLAMATIDIGSMLQSDDPNDDADAAGEQLVATIQRVVQPNGWDTAGGPGTIAVFKGLIIVRHTPDVIGEVNRFVDVLRLDLERRSAANSRP